MERDGGDAHHRHHCAGRSLHPPPNSLRLCERIHNDKNNRLEDVSRLTPGSASVPSAPTVATHFCTRATSLGASAEDETLVSATTRQVSVCAGRGRSGSPERARKDVSARVHFRALCGAWRAPRAGHAQGARSCISRIKNPRGFQEFNIRTVERSPGVQARLPLTRPHRVASLAMTPRSRWDVRGVGEADRVNGTTAAAQRRRSTRLCTRCRAAPVAPLVVAPRAHP